MTAIFYWLGVIVAAVTGVGLAGFALLYLYTELFYGRFQWIPFRTGQRRLSIASWHGAKLTTAKHYEADDFPIGLRPFYLSYRVGERRLFIMLGTHGPSRISAMHGKHPEDAA